MKNWFLAGAVFFQLGAKAQLADGTTAPDFTLTDINGTTHHLYDYLNAGKTVIIDFFAAHCPTCWSYHNTHAVKDFYNDHGPAGTVSQNAMVIAIEFDAGNGHNELYGVSGVTQGDWVTGTPYPIINPEGTDRNDILGAYAVWFYPMVYRICPDKKVLYVGIPTSDDLASYLDYCTMTSVPSVPDLAEKVYVDFELGRLYYQHLKETASYQLNIYDISGKQVMQLNPIQSGSVLLQGILEKGTYIFNLVKNGTTCTNGKFVVR